MTDDTSLETSEAEAREWKPPHGGYPEPAPAARAIPASDLAPGIMRCARCKFKLIRQTLYMGNGAVGAGSSESEPCPNGCGPLWPVTWREEAQECYALNESLFERAHAAEQRLERLKPTLFAGAPSPEGMAAIATLTHLGYEFKDGEFWRPPLAPVASWAALLHYPEHWCTTAYPTLHHAIAEALAAAGCSACKDPEAHY